MTAPLRHPLLPGELACARPGCGHGYTWHDGWCEASVGFAGLPTGACDCPAFAWLPVVADPSWSAVMDADDRAGRNLDNAGDGTVDGPGECTCTVLPAPHTDDQCAARLWETR